MDDKSRQISPSSILLYKAFKLFQGPQFSPIITVVCELFISHVSYLFFSLGECCTHVAALLFRVEATAQYGLNDPSPTDVACKWIEASKGSTVSLCFHSAMNRVVSKIVIDTELSTGSTSLGD